MTKPADNSHQDPEDSTLWDRLRADLDALGAAYGALPAVTPQGPLTPFGEAIQRYGLPRSYPRTQVVKVELSEADRNAYFDGIILAARKKRERQSWIEHCDREDGQTWDARQAELDRSQMLEAAMSSPLTFEPRVGWKGAPLDQ